ncbi:MAG: menaquinone biosynthesis protein [Phycisphaeraceae bacterium]|nr:menaquinone biosynthesis protein [Phycisphaeraceae bacterium]
MTSPSIGTHPPSTQANRQTLRLGCVSYLNTLPLIEGLQVTQHLELRPAPPARLIDMLLDDSEGGVDAALVSLIDYQRSPEPLTLIPVGMIASPAETHTVRLFSRTPIGEIKTLCCDAESHTSVALARIILAERYGITPAIRPIQWGSSESKSCDAVLLIGDKVAGRAPARDDYPHQLDLGASWREMTGLPFVYAVWMCRARDEENQSIRSLVSLLDRTRRHNTTRLGWIANTRAGAHKWEPSEARRYLQDLLAFEVTDDARAAVERFFDLAYAHNLIDNKREVRWLSAPGA